MTEVRFFRCHSHLIGFEATGHSGYADGGSDIVCAAVSAVTQTAAIQAETVLNMKDAVSVSEEGATLRAMGDGGEAWETALEAMRLFLTELSRQYPKHLTIHITEV